MRSCPLCPCRSGAFHPYPGKQPLFLHQPLHPAETRLPHGTAATATAFVLTVVIGCVRKISCFQKDAGLEVLPSALCCRAHGPPSESLPSGRFVSPIQFLCLTALQTAVPLRSSSASLCASSQLPRLWISAHIACLALPLAMRRAFAANPRRIQYLRFYFTIRKEVPFQSSRGSHDSADDTALSVSTRAKAAASAAPHSRSRERRKSRRRAALLQ